MCTKYTGKSKKKIGYKIVELIGGEIQSPLNIYTWQKGINTAKDHLGYRPCVGGILSKGYFHAFSSLRDVRKQWEAFVCQFGPYSAAIRNVIIRVEFLNALSGEACDCCDEIDGTPQICGRVCDWDGKYIGYKGKKWRNISKG